jgi:negative regulator of flagellin synthesis FlgM
MWHLASLSVEHIMKIGQFEPKHTPNTAQAAERRAAGKPASGSAEPSAKVELSSAGALVAASPDDVSFDKAKVDRISAAIREGRFQVDASAIADKLIANAQELLGRSRN